MTRWGVMGTGGVANAFAEALRDVSDAELVAVGSRDQIKADRFAGHHVTVSHAWPSYESLAADPGVDVVYVASPASHHYRHAMLAINAGKHVLVEKPFTTTAAQTARLFLEAQAAGVFLMEAMWSRFLPAYVTLRKILADGLIGDVRAVDASFGGKADLNRRARPFRRDLAGGALMDAAVYPISFAQMILGTVSNSVSAWASWVGHEPNDVDGQTSVLMGSLEGRSALALGGVTTTFEARAVIYGTVGMIVLPGNHSDPPYLDVHFPGQESIHDDFDRSRHRLAWQVDEVHRCLAAGRLESEIMPSAASIEVMRVLDAARLEIGLTFPDDAEAL